MTDRFVSTDFCDDIRLETGNKTSLIGCYGPLILLAQFPAWLPKLCAYVRVFTPVTRPFQKLAVRVLRGENVIAQIPFAAPPLDSLPTIEGARHQVAMAIVTLSPFPVEEPCTLRIEAETEDETLYGGSIWFRTPESVGMPPITQHFVPPMPMPPKAGEPN